VDLAKKTVRDFYKYSGIDTDNLCRDMFDSNGTNITRKCEKVD
jgi:hypothetical protein